MRSAACRLCGLGWGGSPSSAGGSRGQLAARAAGSQRSLGGGAPALTCFDATGGLLLLLRRGRRVLLGLPSLRLLARLAFNLLRRRPVGLCMAQDPRPRRCIAIVRSANRALAPAGGGGALTLAVGQGSVPGQQRLSLRGQQRVLPGRGRRVLPLCLRLAAARGAVLLPPLPRLRSAAWPACWPRESVKQFSRNEHSSN